MHSLVSTLLPLDIGGVSRGSYGTMRMPDSVMCGRLFSYLEFVSLMMI